MIKVNLNEKIVTSTTKLGSKNIAPVLSRNLRQISMITRQPIISQATLLKRVEVKRDTINGKRPPPQKIFLRSSSSQKPRFCYPNIKRNGSTDHIRKSTSQPTFEKE